MGSIRFSLVTLLGRLPLLFRHYYGQHPRYAKLLVRPDSEIVIEGYPRCANSFSVLAFERAQGRRLSIGHHLHAPAQIVLGVRYDKPILVLIRDPMSAVASLMTRHPEISATQALRQYVSFYSCVEKHIQHIVLANFRTVTTDYARVIDAVNRRFDTTFLPYVNTGQEDQAVFSEIDALNAETEDGAEHKLARPSEGKQALLQDARLRIERLPLSQHARSIFDRLTKVCV